MMKALVTPARRGPVARTGRARVTVYLDESLAEWGKQQDGGLSDLLRRLLAQAYDQRTSRTGAIDSDLLTRYHALTDLKLIKTLSSIEEIEWHRLRETINAADHESPLAKERERAARLVDEEFARLRERIEALPVKEGNYC